MRGEPAYGQVFLAEAMGGGILTYAVLCLKISAQNRLDLYTYPIGYTIVSIALNQLFSAISGGVFNPGGINRKIK